MIINANKFIAVLASVFALVSCGGTGRKPTEVPEDVMRHVYEETKTPFKYGIVVSAPEAGQMTDSPSVFRKGRNWYMTYIIFDGKGYETWIAESPDLLHWTTLGRVLSFGEEGEWDATQRAGYLALVDPEWGGKYGLQKYKGRYWMSYLGGGGKGYEQGDLSSGIAYTEAAPTVAHEWERLPEAVMSPKDADVRWWDNGKIFKNTIWRDRKKLSGHKFFMFYNSSNKEAFEGHAAGVERISMAVSDDMVSWRRAGDSPALDHGRGITGDAYLQRMGKLWVMFYFGFNWTPEIGNRAWDTFACSYDLEHWTDWTGEPLVEPTPGGFDGLYAHKPCIVKWKGVVYHFYCAVDKNGKRAIALATSKEFADR